MGSFGNNFNNRVEEALGNATDFWAAYAKGGYTPSARPWLGYLFMLEESDTSMRPTKRIKLAPYPVDEAFQELSYAKRYEAVCQRLVRERLYDAASFFTSNAKDGMKGKFTEPNAELGIGNFAISLSRPGGRFCSNEEVKNHMRQRLSDSNFFAAPFDRPATSATLVTPNK